MRILATCDLHWGHDPIGDEATRRLADVVNQISDADVLLIAGDVAGIDKEKYSGLVALDAEGSGYLIRKRAIAVYETGYFTAVNNRAFAQSASGAWGWSQDMVATEAAMDSALEQCRNHNQSDELELPCKIVNVNGYWAARFFADK